MDCSLIPNADQWKKASRQQLHEYRIHVQSCYACRKRIFRDSPADLLFDLNHPELPEDFWIGFWESLYPKLEPVRVKRTLPMVPILRWAIAVACAVFVVLFTNNNRPVEKISEVPSLNINQNSETDAYPLIEEVQSPSAKYYIIQPDSMEKIVLMFDPEMEL